MLLPPLHDLVVEIERDDIRGGQILNLLYKRCHCGVPELKVCLQRYQIRLLISYQHAYFFRYHQFIISFIHSSKSIEVAEQSGHILSYLNILGEI